METPNHWNHQLKNVQLLLANQAFNQAVVECGKILEQALKGLYDRLFTEIGHTLEWEEMMAEFESKMGSRFNGERMTLGGLLILTKITCFWDLLSIQCRSNLEITKNLPWSKVRVWRNKATHEDKQFEKYEALEVFQYTKVLLYDTDLIPGQDLYSNLTATFAVRKCHNKDCGCDLAEDWQYCPKCGERSYQKCSRCKKDLHPDWSICPYCNMSRGVMKAEDELKHLYRAYCEAIWADYIITPNESRFLEMKRIEFGLNPKEAKAIESEVIPKNYLQFIHLVEACSIDKVIDEDEEEFLLTKALHYQIDTASAKMIIDNQRELLSSENSGVKRVKLVR